MMDNICGDNRFEIIAKAKAHLLDTTNIDTSEDEMKVLDDFLFRCWQMGWLDRYDRKTENSSEKPNNCEVKNYCDDCLYTDTCDDKAFFYACTSKATISKMEQVDKDINVRSKDKPQTDKWSHDCIGCGRNELCRFAFTDAVKICRYIKDEPQTEDFQDWKDRMWAEAVIEPQTDCNGCKFVGAYDTEFPCANCSRKTKDYYAKDEPQTERKDK